MSELRRQAATIANALVGFSADPTDVYADTAYLDLIAPGEPQAKSLDMAKMSGCGLVVAGIWRKLGIKHSRLSAPYVIGTGIRRLIEIAREARAWVPFTSSAQPATGDMVLVGDGGKGGVEHVYTVIKVITQPNKQLELETIDGGQLDAAGNQCIARRKRRWDGQQDIVTHASDPGAMHSKGRTIQGWVDITRLPLK